MCITKWTILILTLISACYVADIKCDEITANEHVRIERVLSIRNGIDYDFIFACIH